MPWFWFSMPLAPGLCIHVITSSILNRLVMRSATNPPPSDVALIGTQSFLMEIVERTVLWFDEVLHDVEAHEAP